LNSKPYLTLYRLHRAQYFRLGTPRYGPGDGAWLVEAPEVHGLNSAALASAAARVGRELGQRDCLVVVKGGVIVHETYYGGATKDTVNYLASVGKTAAALVIGAAVRAGKLSLDTPLVDYGIVAPTLENTPKSSLRARAAGGSSSGGSAMLGGGGIDWGDEWPLVTTRHLLAQVTGRGAAQAGSRFDYDSSGLVLGVLSQVLRAVTGQPPAAWAREHLTAPLGVPDFFAHDQLSGHISAAGGQMATCRDAARFGQLIANGGHWLSADGSLRTLVDPWFVEQMTAATFPDANPQYGFLTWVHPGKTAEGKPRAPPTSRPPADAR
jgi:CubicO group peptidase (beta-lactamase class C family)